MPFVNRFRGCDGVECGLVYFLEGLHLAVPVPLKSVKIEARVVDFVSQVSVVQEYVNRETRPIEATYMFPVEEEAAVIDFEAEVESVVIHTRIEEREKAKKEYEEAVSQQRTAFLLEETKPDIFQIKVGHLKPGASAKVTLTYVSELPTSDSGRGVRLTVPTTIAPRYVPPTDNSAEASKIAQIPYQWDTPAPLVLEVEAITQHKIKGLSSPSHDLKVGTVRKENEKFVCNATLNGAVADMNRDVIILVEGDDDFNRPVVFLETDETKETSAGMVSLVPSFNLKEQKVELIFLVDRSGSMGGVSIQQAKKALLLFLHSLPATCYFNIYSFGSRFDSLFGQSVEYTDDTLDQAKNHVQGMDANYGGTEIFQPLNEIFKVPPRRGYLRQVFVLTDGAVSNDHQVIALVKKNASHGRVFSLGLGNSCSRHLVKGIARAGNGTSVFAAAAEDLRSKVMSLLKNSLQPAITEVRVAWQGTVDTDKGLKATQPELKTEKTLLGFMKPKVEKEIPLTGQAPVQIPPIYDGSRLLVYRLFSKKEQPTGVTVTAETPEGQLSVSLPLSEAGLVKGSFVHQLAARKRIQDLEEASIEQYHPEMIKDAITKLGLQYKLSSKHTSFVGVDPRESRRFYGGMVERLVANQMALGYGARLGGGQMNATGTPVPGYCGFSTRASFNMYPRAVTCGPMPEAQRKCKKVSLSASRGRQRSRSGSRERSENLVSSAESFGAAAAVTHSAFYEALDMDSFLTADEGALHLAPETAEVDGVTQTSMLKRPKRERRQSVDSLTEIIHLQSAGGMFKWGPPLETAFKKSATEALAAGAQGNVAESVWITALVVAYLEGKMVEQRDLWDLVVAKAKSYLTSQLGNDSDVQSILKRANDVVAAL